jgi:hypothetical protein
VAFANLLKEAKTYFQSLPSDYVKHRTIFLNIWRAISPDLYRNPDFLCEELIEPIFEQEMISYKKKESDHSEIAHKVILDLLDHIPSSRKDLNPLFARLYAKMEKKQENFGDPIFTTV